VLPRIGGDLLCFLALVRCKPPIGAVLLGSGYLFTELFRIYPMVKVSMEKMKGLAFIEKRDPTIPICS
jgi:hypothetical protein